MGEAGTPDPGRVVGIALRTRAGGPMTEVPGARAPQGGWLGGDHGGSERRGVTFLSREAWTRVNQDLGADLPWHVRRANVCVEGLDLPALIGRRVRVGQLVLDVLDETRPCDLMDEMHPGLQAALRPEGRGGVYGRVLEGGLLQIGDSIEILPANADG